MSDDLPLNCCCHCLTFFSSNYCFIRRSYYSNFVSWLHPASLSLWFAHNSWEADLSSPFSLLGHMINSFVLITNVIEPFSYLLVVPSFPEGSSSFDWCCYIGWIGLLHFHLFILIHLCFMSDVPNLVKYSHLMKLTYSFFDFDVAQLFVTRAYYCIANFVIEVCYQPDLGPMQTHYVYWFPYCSL